MLGREFARAVVFAGLFTSTACASRAEGTPLPHRSSPRAPDAGNGPRTPRPRAPQRDVASMLTIGATAAEWSCAPDGTASILSTTASDARAPLDTRLRAIDGLAWIPEAAAADALRSIVRDESEGAAIRSAAAIALARRLGAAAVSDLRPLLESPDPACVPRRCAGWGLREGPRPRRRSRRSSNASPPRPCAKRSSSASPRCSRSGPCW
ncbi:MAG: HEAT repeat domain-containing protein [Myxococcaceae bacterium]|nr:HEAT repeat domain-containing protein [Myxococcaceae bacterium]